MEEHEVVMEVQEESLLELRSLGERSVLEIPHRLQMRPFNSL